MKIAIVGNTLPLYNPPTRVAEEFAMIDNISNGRLMDECGIDARAVPFEHSEVEPGMELFVSRKRG